MDVTAVIPVWNGRDLLARLLDTLAAQTHPAAGLLVVDNGSTDGAPELAAARGARVLSMGSNRGFAAAVNRGLGECRTEFTAVLNSDVELSPEWLARLLSAFEDPDVWFAAGKILDARRNGRVDGCWDAVSRAGCAWRVGSGRLDGPPFDRPRRIHLAPWTALVFRTALFARTGLLDESYESYLEDVEFGLRCGGRGLAGRYVPSAIAWHHGSATLGRWHRDTVRRIARNQLLLVAAHYPLRWAWQILCGQALWGLVALRHGAALAFLHGKLQGVGSFAAARRLHAAGRKDITRFIAESEREILHVQRECGFDRYWRFYFLLGAGEAS